MSILEKFFKNKKGPSEMPEEKPFEHSRIYVYHHIKSILEDGKLYDTSVSKKKFSDETSLECIALDTSKKRIYFLTPHGRWFSAEEETVISNKIEEFEDCRVQFTKVIFTYSSLRTEQEDAVKAIMGKNGYELYREYFGEVEEA